MNPGGEASFRFPFLERGVRRGWSHAEVRIFAPEYYAWVSNFPHILSLLTARVRDDESRSFLASILAEELGNGTARERHAQLLRRCFIGLGLPSWTLDRAPYLRSTTRLVRDMRLLYAGGSVARALGAQAAFERQAVPMIEKLHAGLARFVRGGEASRYFEVHMVAEPRHARLMAGCLRRYVRAPKDRREAASGAVTLSLLLGAFWDAMDRECAKLPSLVVSDQRAAGGVVTRRLQPRART
jgi:pyrroloquinoline quinone (PQQ) biosynthesis protein C